MKLTAIQTQLFHTRGQGPNESVDDFTQELRQLHSRAYSTAIGASAEAEQMGQIVLVNQFVSGLHAELQAKLMGSQTGVTTISPTSGPRQKGKNLEPRGT